ncbi:factor-independent urate hydroxylase [Actinoplanes sp. NPDC051861]|uniref:factor-independent urate hydroxylase n=1 Tax=Actinoplanes sp. NPDC051861 TaxID=3155170 RepID=UPI00342C598E
MLGPNRYGKAETRLVRVSRDGDTHGLVDFNVSVALAGDLTATHLTGDNSGVLPTDTMKNTVYAFAKKHGPVEPEAFALLLGRHFVGTQSQVRSATVSIESFAWERLGPHSFQKRGDFTRTALVTVTEDAAQVVSGVTGLVLLNSTDSEFHGFVRDEYTTLPETTDRILATAVDARWRHLNIEKDWLKSYDKSLEALKSAFIGTYSFSLQQTLYAMGQNVLADQPDIVEIRLALPNKHHYLVDLSSFGETNDNEVFIAGDRPYGLIEGTVTRDDAPAAIAEWWL